MTDPIETRIADARAEVTALIRRSEDLLVARRPIDFALDAEISRAEDGLAALLSARAFARTSDPLPLAA